MSDTNKPSLAALRAAESLRMTFNTRALRVENDQNVAAIIDAYMAPALSALKTIAGMQRSAPEYQEWGGDTEAAECWGISTGQYEAGCVARRALAGMNSEPAPGF